MLSKRSLLKLKEKGAVGRKVDIRARRIVLRNGKISFCHILILAFALIYEYRAGDFQNANFVSMKL
jgi:hypothetical protein